MASAPSKSNEAVGEINGRADELSAKRIPVTHAAQVKSSELNENFAKVG